MNTPAMTAPISTPVTIRPYAATDWPRLCAIHDAARRDELRLSVGEAAFLTLEQTADNEGLFDAALDVAEVGGVVQGFVAYDANEVNWLYVDPAQYGRGIGRTLLRHALAHAGPAVSVSVLEGNEPALQLYRSEGFVVTARLEGKLNGNERFPAVGYTLVRERRTSACSG
jgi:ribosomal-protein-alanine N-acetyltransferase